MFRSTSNIPSQKEKKKEIPIAVLSSFPVYNSYTNPDTFYNSLFKTSDLAPLIHGAQDPFFEAMDFRSRVLGDLPENLKFIAQSPKGQIASFINTNIETESQEMPKTEMENTQLEISANGETPAYSISIQSSGCQLFESKTFWHTPFSITRGASSSYRLMANEKQDLGKEIETNLTQTYAVAILPLALADATNNCLLFHPEIFRLDINSLMGAYASLLSSQKGALTDEVAKKVAKELLGSPLSSGGQPILSQSQISTILSNFENIIPDIFLYAPDTGLVSKESWSSTRTLKQRAEKNLLLLDDISKLDIFQKNKANVETKLLLYFDPQAADKPAQEGRLKHELKILSDELARINPNHPLISRIAPFLLEDYAFGSGQGLEELINRIRAVTHQDPGKTWATIRSHLGIDSKNMEKYGFEMRLAVASLMSIVARLPMAGLLASYTFDPKTLKISTGKNGEIEFEYLVSASFSNISDSKEQKTDPEAAKTVLSNSLAKNPPRIDGFEGEVMSQCEVSYSEGGNYVIRVKQSLKVDDPQTLGSLSLHLDLNFLNQKPRSLEIAYIRAQNIIPVAKILEPDIVPKIVEQEIKKEEAPPHTVSSYEPSENYLTPPPPIQEILLRPGVGASISSFQTPNALSNNSDEIDPKLRTLMPPITSFAQGFVEDIRKRGLRVEYDINDKNNLNLFLKTDLGPFSKIGSVYPYSSLYAQWDNAIAGLLGYNLGLLKMQATLPNGVLAGEHFMNANLTMDVGGIFSLEDSSPSFGRVSGRDIKTPNSTKGMLLGSTVLDFNMKNNLYGGSVEVSTNVGANLFYAQQNEGRTNLNKFISLATEVNLNTLKMLNSAFDANINFPASPFFGGGIALEEGRGGSLLKKIYASAGIETEDKKTIFSLQVGRQGLHDQGSFINARFEKKLFDDLSLYANYGKSSTGFGGSVDHLFFGAVYEIPIVKTPKIELAEQKAELEYQRSIAMQVHKNCNKAIGLLENYEQNGFELKYVKNEISNLEINSQALLYSLPPGQYLDYTNGLKNEYGGMAELLKTELNWDGILGVNERYPNTGEQMEKLKTQTEISNSISIIPLIDNGTIIGKRNLAYADYRLHTALMQAKNISKDIPNVSFSPESDLEEVSSKNYLRGITFKLKEQLFLFSEQIKNMSPEEKAAYVPVRQRLLIIGNGGKSSISDEDISLLTEIANTLNVSFDMILVGKPNVYAQVALSQLCTATGGVMLDNTALRENDFLNQQDAAMDKMLAGYMQAISEDKLSSSKMSLGDLWGISSNSTIDQVMEERAQTLNNTPYRYGGASEESGMDCSHFVWTVLSGLEEAKAIAIDDYMGQYMTATNLVSYLSNSSQATNFITTKVASSNHINATSFDDVLSLLRKKLAYTDSKGAKKEVGVSQISRASNFELQFKSDKGMTHYVEHAMDGNGSSYLMLNNVSTKRQTLGSFILGEDGGFSGRFYNMRDGNQKQLYVTSVGGKSPHAGIFTRMDADFGSFSLEDLELPTKLAAAVPAIFNIPSDAISSPPVWSEDGNSCKIEFAGWNESKAQLGRYCKAMLEINFETGKAELRKYQFKGRTISTEASDFAILPLKIEGTKDDFILKFRQPVYMDMTSGNRGAHLVGSGGRRKGKKRSRMSGLYMNVVDERSLQVYNGKNLGFFKETFQQGGIVQAHYSTAYGRSANAMKNYYVFGPVNRGDVDLDGVLDFAVPLAGARENIDLLEQRFSKTGN